MTILPPSGPNVSSRYSNNENLIKTDIKDDLSDTYTYTNMYDVYVYIVMNYYYSYRENIL